MQMPAEHKRPMGKRCMPDPVKAQQHAAASTSDGGFGISSFLGYISAGPTRADLDPRKLQLGMF